ncbi:MAG: hypothetical protein AB4352_02130 [Hormoscilla sp.]
MKDQLVSTTPEPDRILYLAIPESAYEALFGEILIQDLLVESILLG